MANQVPLIGHQLTEKIHVLRRSSVIGLMVGLAGLIWGASGLAQAGLFTMEQVWNLPGPARPGYFPRLGRALEFLGMLAVGVVLRALVVDEAGDLAADFSLQPTNQHRGLHGVTAARE